jgi:hypothetical protein
MVVVHAGDVLASGAPADAADGANTLTASTMLVTSEARQSLPVVRAAVVVIMISVREVGCTIDDQPVGRLRQRSTFGLIHVRLRCVRECLGCL